MKADMSDDILVSPVEQLYNRHHQWLRSWLHRRLRHSADAEDLAHDTFICVLRTQQDVRELGQPMAFLASIANGLLINRWRRQAIERAYLEVLAARPEAEEPSPETRYLMIETLLQLDSLLVGLSVRLRQIFFLSQLDGLTYPQIATQLNLSVPQVQRAMSKAFSVCYASRFE
jgi:RNA polymerase sigma-70 factor (ECF subfamily)